MDLLLLSSVCNQVFYYLPVHQRLPAKEIHFQISSASGICDQEIQCFFADFVAHQGTTAMILTFFCKAVTTGEVTVVSNVQAECLHNSRTVFKCVDCIFIDIFGKQCPGFFQFMTFFQCFFDLCRSIAVRKCF